MYTLIVDIQKHNKIGFVLIKISGYNVYIHKKIIDFY